MKPVHRFAVLFLASLLPAAALHAADAVNRDKLYQHVRKRYSLPHDLTVKLKDLKTSPIPGFLTGRIEFSKGKSKTSWDIHITKDGRYYFIAPLYETRPADIPGLRVPAAAPGEPPPPPIYISPDGKHILTSRLGKPEDLNIDPDKENMAKLRLDNVHAQGPKNAPVVLVEFSDLQCPHCSRAHKVLAENLKKTYGGKVRWVSKHYPLRRTHPWAYDGAIAVACAGVQKPKAYHSLQAAFFARQKTLTKKTLRAKALELAQKAGLDAKVFLRCFDKKETAALVDADIKEGDSLGVMSTPTIFINGRRAPSYAFEALRPIIDEMLAAQK